MESPLRQLGRSKTSRAYIAAIDMWSTGIMLLSILTHKFPIFNSNDDVEALMEIAGIYGRPHMEKCAMLHSESPHPKTM
jgi:cell division control protein 7